MINIMSWYINDKTSGPPGGAIKSSVWKHRNKKVTFLKKIFML